MTIVTELGTRISAFSFDMLPPEAVHWAKIGVLDTVGTTLAGASEPCARIAARVAAVSPGASLLIGTAQTAAPLDAATVNGTAAHAHDFDDCSNTMGGHPSAPVLAALLALADTRRVSGRDLLTAYVAGFETETRLGRAVNFHHYDKGWHPTATLGTFGAAAACARLLDLSPERVATALALAASFAAGLKAGFGTMTKPLHVGQAARNGLFAALLAAEGFTAAADALEHRQGFFMVFNGEGNFDAARVLDGWAAPLDIIDPGIGLKQYPNCASTHPAIDCAIDLQREHGLTPDMIAHVDCWTHPRRLAHTNRPDPRSALDAKFSVQYGVARALTAGRVVLDDFDGERYADPATRALMARVVAAPHPDMPMASTEHAGGEVRVRLHDGRVLARRTDHALGRGYDRPLPLALLRAKFADCAGRVMNAASTARVAELIWHLDELDETSTLRQALAEGCRTRQASLAPA
jgi:2-methylcitrate dehydratase PrpD